MTQKLYTVAWVVDVEADGPEAAAREAMLLRNEQDDDRIDNQFYVTEANVRLLLENSFKSVDLDVIDGRI